MKELLNSIQGPALILDEAKCKANIKRMHDKFKAKNISFRPHLKTPQSAYIAEFLKEAGIHQATVSSVQMAEYFAQHGWDDLCIAFPYNFPEWERINALAHKIKLSIVVTNVEHILHIARHISAELGIWIKFNTGSNRTGIPLEDNEQIQRMLEDADANNVNVCGLLAHSGHTYGHYGAQAVEKIHREAIDGLIDLKTKLFTSNKLAISYGDTPACTLSEYFPEIDEVRPGNFMFYDLVMSEHAVCSVDDIAVAMACPVVATHPERNEVVLYGGAVHFSKDSMQLADGNICYGKLSRWTDTGWTGNVKDAVVRKLSQEHAVLSLPKKTFEQIQIGDVLPILPVHSCLMVDCMSHYYSTAGSKIDKFHYNGYINE